MGTIDGLPPLREVIRAHDLVAKRQLGQNFLLDLNPVSYTHLTLPTILRV